MSEGTLSILGYSTLEVRKRAVKAVAEDGLTVTEVAQAYGTDRSTIHRWLARYYQEGDDGLDRRAVSGRPRKLRDLDADGLKQIVMAPSSEYGFETDFWTTRRLIQIVKSEFDVAISKQTMMRRLHEAGLTYQKPERQYFELSEEERQDWRRRELPKIRRAVRKHQAILYFQDEANISLTALLAKTWAPCGDAEAGSHRQTRWSFGDVGNRGFGPTYFSLARQTHRVGGSHGLFGADVKASPASTFGCCHG